MKRTIVFMLFLIMNNWFVWGQDSTCFFSNNDYFPSKALLPGNEDGTIFPSLYEIQLPHQPLRVYSTYDTQVIILSKDNLFYISQEPGLRGKHPYRLTDLVWDMSDFVYDNKKFDKLLNDLSEDRIVQIKRIEDFVIVAICGNAKEWDKYRRSIESFVILKKGGCVRR